MRKKKKAGSFDTVAENPPAACGGSESIKKKKRGGKGSRFSAPTHQGSTQSRTNGPECRKRKGKAITGAFKKFRHERPGCRWKKKR